MAYLDLKTFEIWAESNIDGFHDEHIEVDETIAPIIRELNLKGYKTKFCCSGHPYYAMNELFASSEETAKGIGGLVEIERVDDASFPVRALYIRAVDDFYISFDGLMDSDFSIPLPDGFRWDSKDTIRFEYTTDDVYGLLEERLNACKALFQWAASLPHLQNVTVD